MLLRHAICYGRFSAFLIRNNNHTTEKWRENAWRLIPRHAARTMSVPRVHDVTLDAALRDFLRCLLLT